MDAQPNDTPQTLTDTEPTETASDPQAVQPEAGDSGKWLQDRVKETVEAEAKA